MIRQRFNSISNFFSRRQIKSVIEGLPTLSSRKEMIDRVIQRREEIKNSEENFKIHKYAHVFRKLLYKFRVYRTKK
jgi:hypothetical protein